MAEPAPTEEDKPVVLCTIVPYDPWKQDRPDGFTYRDLPWTTTIFQLLMERISKVKGGPYVEDITVVACGRTLDRGQLKQTLRQVYDQRKVSADLFGQCMLVLIRYSIDGSQSCRN